MEDTIYYKPPKRIYEDLYDEISTWLYAVGNTNAQQKIAGVYEPNGEIGISYAIDGYCGITVTVPAGYDLLSYAKQVYDRFEKTGKVLYKRYTNSKYDKGIIFVQDDAKCVNMPFMCSDKDYRDEWRKKHSMDRTLSREK